MPMRPIAYVKMAIAAVTCVIGGPALVMYVTPDPDELFKRYNPDLQRKTIAMREERTERYRLLMEKMKEYSKSDKPIWVVAAEEEKKQKAAAVAERRRVKEEMERQKREILAEQLGKS